MLQSILDFISGVVNDDWIRGASVLEVGSLNVNGSPRSVIARFGPKEYIGVDARPGPDVDVVLEAENLHSIFGARRFDIVISTEMLEHALFWRQSLWNMVAVLKKDGLLVITTRSPGYPRHDFPGDYWRFTVEDFAALFGGGGFICISIMADPQEPGVFFAGVKVTDDPISFDDISVQPQRVAA
jgi:hypothetical protein